MCRPRLSESPRFPYAVKKIFCKPWPPIARSPFRVPRFPCAESFARGRYKQDERLLTQLAMQGPLPPLPLISCSRRGSRPTPNNPEAREEPHRAVSGPLGRPRNTSTTLNPAFYQVLPLFLALADAALRRERFLSWNKHILLYYSKATKCFF